MQIYLKNFGDKENRVGFDLCSSEQPKPFRLTAEITKGALSVWIDAYDSNYEYESRYLLTKFLLEQIEFAIASGITPGDQDWIHNFIIDSTNLPDKAGLRAKICKYQELDKFDNLICAACVKDDHFNGMTSVAICADVCNVPDQTLQCSHFAHVQVATSKLPENVMGPRRLSSSLCDKGLTSGITCVPWEKKQCWEKILTPPPLVVSSHAPIEQIANAIDLINLYFKPAMKDAQIIPTPKAGRIAYLAKTCNSEAEFRTGISNISSIIETMAFDKLAEPKERGSINALEQYLQDKHSGEGRPVIKLLRAITTIRGFDQHQRYKQEDKVLASFSHLGIMLPIYVWPNAWNQVLNGFLTALNGLIDIIRVDM